MKSGVLYLYGGIWEEGEKDFKLRGRNHLFPFCIIPYISGSVTLDHLKVDLF
jgi:hypothetical protein